MDLRDLGLIPYAEALELMRELAGAVARGAVPETLLIAAHPPVITLGRKRGAAGNVLDPGPIPVVAVERGGDATYHGPGQVILYPIVRLEGPRRDLHRYLRDLEEAIIRGLFALGVAAGRKTGLTGVWVGDRKIASIGVAVRQWTTYHGAAINVAPERGFRTIRACGLDGAVMTSLAEVTGRSWSRAEILAALVPAMQEMLTCPVRGSDP